MEKFFFSWNQHGRLLINCEKTDFVHLFYLFSGGAFQNFVLSFCSKEDNSGKKMKRDGL